MRLHGSKFGKQYTNIVSPRKSLKSPQNKQKRKGKRSLFAPDSTKGEKKLDMKALDELFYERCFNMSDHKCEECGCDLPTEFRDMDGNIVARWRYSHIIAKSISRSLRHDVKNINHLCLKHHTQWDFGDRKAMSIYDNNRKKFPNYL